MRWAWNYHSVQDQHGEIVRATIDANDGHIVRTEGDSFFATFRSPIEAVRAAITAQRGLAGIAWPAGSDLRVRTGLHTGSGVLGGDDYVGIDVNRAARIAAAAHGGQVVLSDATRAMVQHDLPEGVTLRDLGEHRLKDFAHLEHLCDLMGCRATSRRSNRSMSGPTTCPCSSPASWAGPTRSRRLANCSPTIDW
jgi:class 3 adenylate cyclase